MLAQLRGKRSAHPGYALTGGPPKSRAAPGTKTSKQVTEEAKAAKEKAKIDRLKEIAGAEKANMATFASDDMPQAPAARTRGGHCRTVSELSERMHEPGSAELELEAQTEGEGGKLSSPMPLILTTMLRVPNFHLIWSGLLGRSHQRGSKVFTA
jgi:hypothetical protein